MPMAQLQTFLGHAKRETTQGYAASSTARMRERAQRALSRCRARPSDLTLSRRCSFVASLLLRSVRVRRAKAEAGGECVGTLQRSGALFETSTVIPEMLVKGRIALDRLPTAGAFAPWECRADLSHASSKTPGMRGGTLPRDPTQTPSYRGVHAASSHFLRGIKIFMRMRSTLSLCSIARMVENISLPDTFKRG